VQPLLLFLESLLTLGYLNDFALGGPAEGKCRDVSKVYWWSSMVSSAFL